MGDLDCLNNGRQGVDLIRCHQETDVSRVLHTCIDSNQPWRGVAWFLGRWNLALRRSASQNTLWRVPWEERCMPSPVDDTQPCHRRQQTSRPLLLSTLLLLPQLHQWQPSHHCEGCNLGRSCRSLPRRARTETNSFLVWWMVHSTSEGCLAFALFLCPGPATGLIESHGTALRNPSAFGAWKEMIVLRSRLNSATSRRRLGKLRRIVRERDQPVFKDRRAHCRDRFQIGIGKRHLIQMPLRGYR